MSTRSHGSVFDSFELLHTPGISRAYVKYCNNGNQILLTDTGGYDVPSHDGPFQATLLTGYDDLIEGPTELENVEQLKQWIQKQTSAD